MKKILQFIKKFSLLILILLLLLSAGIIYKNKGLHFADYHYQIKVHIDGQDTQKIDESFKTISQISFPARIDKRKGDILFEYVDLNTISSKAADLTKNNKNVNITVTEVLPQDSTKSIFITDIFVTLAIFAVGFLALFYFNLRYNNNLSVKDYRNIFIYMFIVVILVNFFQLGFLSIISLIYQIRNLDLISLYTTPLFLIIYLYLAYYSLKNNKNLSFEQLLKDVSNYFDNNTKLIFFIAFFILAITSFGFGTNFVMTTTAILVGLVINLIVVWLSTSTILNYFYKESFLPIRIDNQQKSEKVKSTNSLKKNKKKHNKKK